MRAGSLLDDNQWHDIEISRLDRQVNFTVDRLTITNMTNGDFYQLDLDRKVRPVLSVVLRISYEFITCDITCIDHHWGLPLECPPLLSSLNPVHSFIHYKHLYSASSSGATQRHSQPQHDQISLGQ